MSKEWDILHTATMPAIALRGLTVFPNVLIHFEVARTASVRALEAAMTAGSPVFLVGQKDISVEEPELCFILVQPDLITDQYRPELPPEAKELLGEGDYMCWLIASLREPFTDSTVNLRSPIVVNPELHQAAQFVLDGSLPIRHPLVREGGAQC